MALKHAIEDRVLARTAAALGVAGKIEGYSIISSMALNRVTNVASIVVSTYLGLDERNRHAAAIGNLIGLQKHHAQIKARMESVKQQLSALGLEAKEKRGVSIEAAVKARAAFEEKRRELVSELRDLDVAQHQCLMEIDAANVTEEAIKPWSIQTFHVAEPDSEGILDSAGTFNLPGAYSWLKKQPNFSGATDV